MTDVVPGKGAKTTDPVATDVVGTMVMGLDPGEIDHLRLCAARSLGEGDPAKIEMVGAELKRVRKRYRRAAW